MKHNSNIDYDTMEFRKYTCKSEAEKALHTLLGIIEGINLDGVINKQERRELLVWINAHQEMMRKYSFPDLVKSIMSAIEDNVIDDEEKKDIMWICNKKRSKYYNKITHDIQELHGIMHGIIADNKITKLEITNLQEWLKYREHLKGIYPYDEIHTLLLTVLEDGIIDQKEENLLKQIFSEFVTVNPMSKIEKIDIAEMSLFGICATEPTIVVPNKIFCFTGKSTKTTRVEIQKTIENHKGIFRNTITQGTHYLIIGNDANPTWAFSCYGRKVEKAIELRKKGNPIIIAHEDDLWQQLQT